MTRNQSSPFEVRGSRFEVVSWGRSFDAYRRMLALSGGDLQRRIVDCGAGPASFDTRRHEAVRGSSRATRPA
jgi:hypothetical protein